MLHIIARVVNALFPPPESVQLIEGLEPQGFLHHYLPSAYQGTVALSHYRNPIIQAAVKSNKFYQSDHAATLLATLLSHWLDTLPHGSYVIVPIPLSRARLRERGYNQVSAIVKRTLLPKHITINEQLLGRTRNTEAQSHLARADRLRNLTDAFIGRPDPAITNTTFIILDDVVTTGATFTAARSALRAAFPNNMIMCVALAH